jgi:hypothetical protein
VDDEFLEMCLGGPDALFEHEVDQQHATDKENATDTSFGGYASKPSPCKSQTQLDEEDSDNELSVGSLPSEGVDLEDMFAFEPETLADLVKNGTCMSKLIAHLQASYADALERRLAGRAASSTDEHESGGSTPRPGLGTVSQNMTPVEVTPVVSPRKSASDGVSASNELSSFAGHALVEAVILAQRRSRRSAALRHRPSLFKREAAAVKAAELYGRRSLAHAQGISSQEVELLQGALQSVVKTVSRRHRSSLNKAVEVLECVADASAEPLERWPEDKVDATVDLIQGAMDEAIKRHRRSIAQAVQGVSASASERDEDAGAFEASGTECPVDVADVTNSAVEARIHRAVSAAFSKRSATSRRELLL